MGERAFIGSVGLVGVLFSCACIRSLPVVGGGCGCVLLGLGIIESIRAHCRVHVQHRVSVHCRKGGGCLHDPPDVVGCGLCVVGCL